MADACSGGQRHKGRASVTKGPARLGRTALSISTPAAQPRCMTTSTTRRGAALAADVWSDHCWPVLAGAMTAVGLLDLCHVVTPLAAGALVIGVWLFLSVVLYGAGSESGLRPRTALRIGLVASVSTMTVLGLTDLFPVGGWFAALALGVTSPWLIHHVTPHLLRALAKVGSRTSTRTATDQAAVDHAFQKIVGDFETDDA